MTVWIVGSLGYHNETIVQPILDELTKRHVEHRWFKPDNEEGANVHVEQCTGETMKYWANFIAVLPKLAKNDVVFILDFWNPAIFEMKFWSTRHNLNIKFITLHHGSSHLPGDFASQPGYEWTHNFEDAWVQCYDKIFFGSYNAIDQFSKLPAGKGIVSYLPFDYIAKVMTKVPSDTVRAEKSVIMPLRLDADKGALEFFEIVKNNPEYTFHASRFHCNVEIPELPNLVMHDAMERDHLFILMSECEYVLSCAKQETFGYGVLEAVMCGCKPILQESTNNCYNEMYDETSLFYDHTKVRIFEYWNSEGLIKGVLDNPAQEVIVKGMLF